MSVGSVMDSKNRNRNRARLIEPRICAPPRLAHHDHVRMHLRLFGNLNVFRQGTEVVAAVYAGCGMGQPGELLPTLYRARLVTMHVGGISFQG